MKPAWLSVPILALLLGGCAKNIQTNDAVKKAVIEYLSKRPDLAMSSMDVDVSGVKFTGDTAEATVSFKPKGMDASAGMQMNYMLERKGDQWVVKPKAAGGANAHGAPDQPAMPPGHPPPGGSPGTAKQ